MMQTPGPGGYGGPPPSQGGVTAPPPQGTPAASMFDPRAAAARGPPSASYHGVMHQQRPPPPGAYGSGAPGAYGAGAPQPQMVMGGAGYSPGAYGSYSGPASVAPGARPAPPAAPKVTSQTAPRPPIFSEQESKKRIVYRTCTPESSGTYPSLLSNFVAVDEGNASPRFMRPTLRCIPQKGDALVATGIPLALEVSPLAALGQGEGPVPVVDFGPAGPPRCNRCRAYMNAHMKWQSRGTSWSCAFCGVTNAADTMYQCQLDGSGMRADRANRPELCKGTVDFAVPETYGAGLSEDPIFVFIIEATTLAVQNGLTESCLKAVGDCLTELVASDKDNVGARVGFITFGETIQFYDMTNAGGPRVVIAADVDQPFAPIPTDRWLMRLPESLEAVQSLLGSVKGLLPSRSQEDVRVEMCGSAIMSAVGCAAESLVHTGGKILVVAQSNPTVGAGQLTLKGKKDERKQAYHPIDLTAPPGDFYMNLAAACALSRISVDAILLGSRGDTSGRPGMAPDVATLGHVPSHTGGRVLLVTGAPHDEEVTRSMSQALLNITRSALARDAAFVVRCGIGLRCSHIQGPGALASGGEYVISSVNSDQSLLCTLEHDGAELYDGALMCIQATMLYTSRSGQRLVRCHTLALPVTKFAAKFYDSADPEEISVVLLRKAASHILEKGLSAPDAMEQAKSSFVKIMGQYRRYMAPNSEPGKMVLSDAFSLLPLYMLCMKKSIALRERHDQVGERASALHSLAWTSSAQAIRSIYPRLFCASSVEGPDLVTTLHPPSAEFVAQALVSILVAGPQVIVYVSGAFLNSLDAKAVIDPSSSGEPVLKKSGPVWNFIEKMKAVSGGPYLPALLAISNSGKDEERAFVNLLVEDKTLHGPSYVDHLNEIHSAILQRM
jgi:protein transport protein SEC24